MIRRRAARASSSEHPTCAYAYLDEWVRSLPWVIERPRDERWPAVRVFVVDCPPLKRRQLLLITGLRRRTSDGEAGSGVAAVMPAIACREPDGAGWAHRAAPSIDGHVLVTTGGDRAPEREDLEALVLKAFSYAMS
jgi:hypothetical protein